jgi:molybdopterin molybdotransferase
MKDMLGRDEAVSVQQALRLILENLSSDSLPEEKVRLEDSYGRVLSKDVVSPEDLPDFSRSTVDGFAVCSSDTFGATEQSPSYLNVSYEILMGEEPDFELRQGEAAKIATGGMLPQGADSVLMLEHAQFVDEKIIEVQRSVAPGENVIRKAEDVGKGELVLGKGHRLRPQDVAVLSGIGLTEVFVFKKPKVSIISTGDEIVPAGAPLKPGFVRDMNSYSLAGLVLREGGIPLVKGIFRDDYEVIQDVVRQSLGDSEMVLITGGSSVGVKDMTERIISRLGKVLFHSVSMKPGKPMIAGVVENKPVFGLPGHPRAVVVCFEVFVRAALRLIAGMKSEKFRITLKARLTKSIHSASGRQEHISVVLDEKNGELWATPLLGKSGLISTLVKADGTITIPQDSIGIEKGELVEVKLF